MRKLDIYILKKYLFTFAYVMGLIMAIAVIFDISERIDDFLRFNPPFWAILSDYYLNFVLFFSNLFSGLLLFISVIWFTSRLASRTEIVAILSSGVSFRRMLLPYFIGASLIAGISLYLNHTILPHANKARLAFEDQWLRKPYKNRDKNIHIQKKGGDAIYFESYNNLKDIGYKFSLTKWEDQRMVYKLNADFARYDTLTGLWSLENYNIREIDGDDEVLRHGLKMDTTLAIDREDLSRRQNSVEAMTSKELLAFIQKKEDEGSDEVPFFLLKYHERSSYPFSTYIFTLIGVAIASRKVRGGIGLHLMMGIVIAVLYILAMKVTSVYATNRGLEPWLAVWIPNFLFLLFGMYIYRVAPK